MSGRSTVLFHVEVEAGDYLTDGVFLYRVVRVLSLGVEEVAELEDCYGLDTVRAPAKELRARRLRLVQPKPMRSAQSARDADVPGG